MLSATFSWCHRSFTVQTPPSSFGSTTLTSAGGSDVFVAKLDSVGNFLWAVRSGGTDSDRGERIALDSSGNIYVSGYFSGTSNFGSTTLTSEDRASGERPREAGASARPVFRSRARVPRAGRSAPAVEGA